MKNYLFLFASLGILFLLTACETFNNSSRSQASSSQDIIELQNKVTAINRQMVNQQDRNARIVQNLSSLQTQINYVNSQNQQQNKSISSLQQKINQEKAERQAALNKVIETVADQTTKTVNSIATQRKQTVKSTKQVPAGAYYKHKIAAGETLSAIARAYKVSVNDIRKANNLKSDVIRVGQILHIPKK